MAVLIVCELALLTVSLQQVASVRAFIEGEALWSKAQKDALIELRNYKSTGNETSFRSFLNYLQVPEGDRLARLELLKADPNLDVVRKGFIQGRIHPDDIDKMVRLLRRFHWLGYVSKAMEEWTKGDELLVKLQTTATQLHSAVVSGETGKSDRLLDEIDKINLQLTPVEDRFSRTLSDGSRWLENRVLLTLFFMVILVESTGLTLTFITGREIAGIADENAILLEEAKRYVKSRDDFLSIASHELKTPLTALGLQLQLIQREAAELSAHGASQRLAGLSSQALVATKRLGTLLDELLDLTRIREGRLEIRKQLCSLTGIIQDSVAILGAEAARRGIAILIEDAGPAMGMYDAGRVSQVMVNLLSNALKYGEGKPIHISIMQAEESAMVNVRDLGKGISEEVLPRIFQRYERFENDPSIPGLGLGLYISYEIVKAQGGSLSVESRVQEGSTFTMKLPVC